MPTKKEQRAIASENIERGQMVVVSKAFIARPAQEEYAPKPLESCLPDCGLCAKELREDGKSPYCEACWRAFKEKYQRKMPPESDGGD